jgi:hypothetical protein
MFLGRDESTDSMDQALIGRLGGVVLVLLGHLQQGAHIERPKVIANVRLRVQWRSQELS